MKIFLTGGTGFVGQPLTRTLIQRRWEMAALARKPESAEAKAVETLEARLIPGDVTDRESMRAAMTGADAVIHNAGWYEFGISKQAHARMRAINVQSAANTLELAVELGIPRIVHVSTILAFGDTGEVVADENFQRRTAPQSCYEQTKTDAHEHAVRLQQHGAPIIIACPAGVIGPGDHIGLGHLVRMAVRGLLPPMLFGANGRRAHILVDDVAEGIVRCLEHGRLGEAYLLSSGNMRHRDMFNLWKQTPGGFKTTLFWKPDALAMLFSQAAEPVERLLGLPVVFCREFALAGFASWQFSAAKAERELGMRFRGVEQAWLDTLLAERMIAQKRKGR